MTQQTLSKRIQSLRDSVMRLDCDLRALDSLDIRLYPENYETLSTDAALRAERIACRLRTLILSTTNVPRAKYLAKAGEAHGITVDYTDGVVEITLPFLLPKKRGRQSGVFLLDPLSEVLHIRCAELRIPRFDECVVCFTHVHDATLPPYRKLDYDNMQQKKY